MNKFEKGRGFAVGSGILFIIFTIINYINFFKNFSSTFRNNTIFAIAVIVLSIIPIVALGIMLIIGKMHFGLVIPPILYCVGFLFSSFNSIIRILIDILWYLPWVFLFIVLILYNNSVKSQKSPSKIIAFLPPIIVLGATIIRTFLSFFFAHGGIDIEDILVLVVLIAAMALLGVWLETNTSSDTSTDKHFEGFYGQSQNMSQQYNQQPYVSGYSPQYYPQMGIQQGTGQQLYQQQYSQQQYFDQTNYQQSVAPQQSANKGNDEVEILIKYKGLLDSGIITQEEFELKKKQIMGI